MTPILSALTPMLSRKIDLATPLDRMATLSPYKRCALVAVRGAAVAAILFPPRSPSTLFSRRVVEFSKAEYLERAKAESRGEVIRDGW